MSLKKLNIGKSMLYFFWKLFKMTKIEKIEKIEKVILNYDCS